MNRHCLLACAIAGLSTGLTAQAGVETLTSDEMVDTYVKDSAVIVVPRTPSQVEDRKRIIRSLTISPGEPVLTEAEEEAYREALQRYIESGREDALENAEEEFVRRPCYCPPTNWPGRSRRRVQGRAAATDFRPAAGDPG